MPIGDAKSPGPVQMKLFGHDGRAIPPESIEHVFSRADLKKISEFVAKKARQRHWDPIAESVLRSQKQLEFVREGIVHMSSARWPQDIELGVKGVVDLGKGRFARIVSDPAGGASSMVRLSAFACTRGGEEQQLEAYKWLRLRGSELKDSKGRYLVRPGDVKQLQLSDPSAEPARLGDFFHIFLGTKVVVAQTLRPWVIPRNSHYPNLPVTVIKPWTNLMIQLDKPDKGKASKPWLKFHVRPTKAPRGWWGAS